MTQELRAFAALLDDPLSILKTYGVAHSCLLTAVAADPAPSLASTSTRHSFGT